MSTAEFAVKNEVQFGFSFWLMVESVQDCDGLPLIYKGKPNNHLVNRSAALVYIKAEVAAGQLHLFYNII